MNLFTYIKRSLHYYKRQHLAVFFGTLLSTAILTGALVIGDSVRLSLVKMVETRLGDIEYALVGGDRFFRTQLANEIASETELNTAALLMLQGIAINNEVNKRVNTVNIYGIDQDFIDLTEMAIDELKGNEAIINGHVSEKLGLSSGDEFLLRIRKASVIPLNAPFVKESQPSIAILLRVKSIVGDDRMGGFSLSNNQSSPDNIFLSLGTLSDRMEINEKVNLLLVAGNKDPDLDKNQLNKVFAEHYNIADLALKTNWLEDSDEFEILSGRIFIDKSISDALLEKNLNGGTVLTYLVNTLGRDDKQTPYSFVSAVTSFSDFHSPGKDEIVVTEWLAKDLGLSKGDSLTLDYYVIGPLRTLDERSRTFTIKNIVPTRSSQVNKSLMPFIPGLTDAGSCSEWETGVPIDLDRIRDKDETYWNNYRGTPKAFINPTTAREIWENSFGEFTALRFSKDEMDLTSFTEMIREYLNPEMLGLEFINIKKEGIRAANNSVDFAGLFIGLSFFVIVAGLLLTIMIYSLNTESRSQEAGVLSATGIKPGLIIRIRFAESAVIALLGGIAGTGAGILYNYALIAALNTVWQDIVRTNMLEVFILPGTLIISAVAGILLAMISIYLVTRRKLKKPVSIIIKKEPFILIRATGFKKILVPLIAVAGIAGAIALALYSIFTAQYENASLFLSAGGLFMIGALASIAYKFRKQFTDPPGISPGLFRFAVKNAGRNRNRSLAAIILLALGTFSFIITGANKKTFQGMENLRQSGTGGFLFWAETTMPLLYNLNTMNGREEYSLEDESILDDVVFMQMHTLDGDDASCLNLNQVSTPVVLGVDPQYLDKQKAFTFVKLMNDDAHGHPWLELEKDYGGNIIPAIADQTVLTWGLMKEIGDTLIYLDENGNQLKLLLVGGLAPSVFQGNVLIADSLFVKHFPSSSGSRTMLVDAYTEDKGSLNEILNTYLSDYGIEITSTTQRLAAFNSVTNTYLTVFLILGGLGVIIGTLGLGIIMIRNIIERKNELALLLALGYKKSTIFWLIMIENAFILITGILCGTLGAAIGILPSLLSPAFNMDLVSIAVILLVIILTGVLSVYFPVRYLLKRNLIDSLRNE